MQKKEKSSNFSPFLSETVLLALVHTLVSILITQLVFFLITRDRTQIIYHAAKYSRCSVYAASAWKTKIRDAYDEWWRCCHPADPLPLKIFLPCSYESPFLDWFVPITWSFRVCSFWWKKSCPKFYRLGILESFSSLINFFDFRRFFVRFFRRFDSFFR